LPTEWLGKRIPTLDVDELRTFPKRRTAPPCSWLIALICSYGHQQTPYVAELNVRCPDLRQLSLMHEDCPVL